MTSCYYDQIEEVEIDPGTVIEFAADIQPIFVDNNCSTTNCHDGNRDPDLRPGNEYSSLVPAFVVANDADNSRLYTFLAFNGHRNLSSIELRKIEEWINSGALNN
jgi:hypothetical protein